MPKIDVERLFTAVSNSAWQFMINEGQGCYIPSYQRPYAWDQDSVGRMLEDLVKGLRQLLDRPETITFLGTIIAIHDTDYQTVHPIFRPEVASRVMTIIDGQQRLSTFVFANIILHDEIRRRAQFADTKDEHMQWLYEQTQQRLVHLQKTFEIDRATGDGNYRYYPRIIRAIDDVWSRRARQAKYESPGARLIWEYIVHSRNNDGPYHYAPEDDHGQPLPLHQPVVDIFKFTRISIVKLIEARHKTLELPAIINMAQNPKFNEGLWGYELPESVREFLTESTSDRAYIRYCSVFRLLVLSLYLNDRLAFTIVTTKNEDDAFDMFEALNTTGAPLTAFETFRPKVIEAEGLGDYELSPSYHHMQCIENYLDRFNKADDRQRATSGLLIPFALAESGLKLLGGLNNQRRFLRDTFDRFVNIAQKREFVESLACVSDFVQHAWDTKDNDFPTLRSVELDDEAMLCISALHELKHHITIAPITRFYDAVLRAAPDDRTRRVEELNGAIKATTAFSMLWRGSRTTTDNIDGHYRDVMKAGIDSLNIAPLAKRTPTGDAGVVSLQNYKRALVHILERQGGIAGEDDWVRLATANPVYTASRVVARFLLLAASDDCVPDKASPGLPERGRAGILPMLTIDRWTDARYLTVEHIVPKNNDGSWPQGFYEDPAIVHRIGNLTLLPGDENALVANRSWAHKRALFAVLSAQTETEYNQNVGTTHKLGLTLSRRAEKILEKSKYLSLCRALASREDEWAPDFMAERSGRLATLAWQRMRPWLD